jgi:hypothetical protein
MADRRVFAQLPDPDLAAALRDLGSSLAWPGPSPVAADPARRARLQIEAVPRRASWRGFLHASGRRRRLRPALVLGLLAALAVGAIAGAIGLGLPGIRIVPAPPATATASASATRPGPSPRPSASPSPSPSVGPTVAPSSFGPLGSGLGLGELIAVDAAAGEATVPLIRPADLGDPATAWILDGRVSLVWPTGTDLPPLGEPRLGLILTEFSGTVDPGYFEKILGTRTTVTPVHVRGVTGYWIAGDPHEIVYVNASDEPVFDSRRIVGNTLLWSDGGVTYRLEAALDRTGAIALADALR